MGSMSIWHWIVLLVIVMLLFGAGKIPRLMGDMAKGIKAFKAGMKDEEETASQSAQPVQPAPAPQVTSNAAASTPAGHAETRKDGTHG